MNLFLETPQRAAGRTRPAHRVRGSSDADGGLGSRLFDEDPLDSRLADGGAAAEPPASRAAEAAFAPAYESYEAELAFAQRRSRRRVLSRVLRSIGMAVALPLLLALIFFISYTVTLILNGATPREVTDHLSLLIAHLEEAVRTILPIG